MNNLSAIFAFCFLLSALAAPAADVIFDLKSITYSPVASRKVLVTPTWMNPTNGVGALDRITYRSDTNGTFTITNMVPGLYSCAIQFPPDRTSFNIFVPDTNATLYAHALRVVSTNDTEDPNSYAWSAAASDARYLSTGLSSVNGSATNLTIYAPADGYALRVYAEPGAAYASQVWFDSTGNTVAWVDPDGLIHSLAGFSGALNAADLTGTATSVNQIGGYRRNGTGNSNVETNLSVRVMSSGAFSVLNASGGVMFQVQDTGIVLLGATALIGANASSLTNTSLRGLTLLTTNTAGGSFSQTNNGNASFKGFVLPFGGINAAPQSSAPTLAFIGGTNIPNQWWSNAVPPALWVTYYNATSNEVSTNILRLP